MIGRSFSWNFVHSSFSNSIVFFTEFTRATISGKIQKFENSKVRKGGRVGWEGAREREGKGVEDGKGGGKRERRERD